MAAAAAAVEGCVGGGLHTTNACDGRKGVRARRGSKEEAYTHTHIIINTYILYTHAEESRERNGTVTRDISFGALASPPPPLTVGTESIL